VWPYNLIEFINQSDFRDFFLIVSEHHELVFTNQGICLCSLQTDEDYPMIYLNDKTKTFCCTPIGLGEQLIRIEYEREYTGDNKNIQLPLLL
jgi:hypothetical protein